jgi:hypothetical protein
MISTILFALFFVSVVALFVGWSLHRRIYHMSNRTIAEVVPFLREVKLPELGALIDPEDEKYLRLNLGEKEFRKAQRRRMLLLLEFLDSMSHNTSVLLEWARSDQRKSLESGEPEWEALCTELVKNCIRFRAGAFAIKWQIHRYLIKSVVLPVGVPDLSELRKFSGFDLLYSYVDLKVAARHLADAYGDTYPEQLVQAL